MSDVLNVRICDLELSVRTRNCLLGAGIRTVGELTSQSEKDLMKINNFGRRTLKEVKEIMGALSLSLRHGPVLTLEEQMDSAIARARAAKQKYEAAMADIRRVAKLMVDLPATLEEPHAQAD